ncbi:MAG: hypothetical protein Q7R39_00795 [Dehalococcoidia bacterium]|nr:hypothetical protein [Dehalococcoidia bacterium]
MGLLFGDGVDIPKHIFKAICQNPECRVALGAMHIPCASGVIIFVCGKCSGVSRFDNGNDGWDTHLLGKVRPKK